MSVVTPVYNGEPYLAQCIESVLAQTHGDFEYIIVNNRSQDQTAAIAEHYARRDPRVRLVNSETFRSQIDNFNYSLSLLAPDAVYCKVVFADDTIFPHCLEQMLQIAETDPEIAVVSAYESDGEHINLEGPPLGTPVISGREACGRYLLTGNGLVGSFNTLLFRADEISRHTPFFVADDGHFEDIEILFKMLKGKKLGFAHQVLTFTRRDNVSTISRIAPFHPSLLMRMMMLRRHGAEVLSASEYDEQLSALKREYHRFLGENMLRGRSAEFWDFHLTGLAKVGCAFSRAQLVCAAALTCLDLALNPKSTLERICQLWRQRSRAPQPLPSN
ncbi:MAG TPA: glycosyltransferase family A protein [Pirellulaceae bacterium]|nr:glycosyltransferase family A protein [Pirellulaceae bacterium]